MSVPNIKILGQVVSEKSLTEKKVYKQTNRPTNIVTEKAKTIYPLYTSYAGGIMKPEEQVKGTGSSCMLEEYVKDNYYARFHTQLSLLQ